MDKDFFAEIRVRVPGKTYTWVKERSDEKRVSLAAVVREALDEVMERSERASCVRSTDPLIERMYPLVESMAEKLGVEVPEKQPDSEAENSAEKEGEIH